MAKITDIQIQKKDSDRVSVFLDNDFWTGMTRNCFNDLKLKNGQELDQEHIKEIESRVVEDSAFNFALKKLSFRQLSYNELHEKMIDREYSPDIVQQTLQKCIDMNFIDDQQMAEYITEIQIEQGKGKLKIQQYLNKRKIEVDMIQSVLEAAFADQDLYALAEKALSLKYQNKQFDRRDQQRAINFLQRQGYSFSIAQIAVAKRALDDDQEAAKHPVKEAYQLLEKKYSLPLTRDDYSKAYSYLNRRGFLPEVIKQALQKANDADSDSGSDY
jgi:regulatory protein